MASEMQKVDDVFGTTVQLRVSPLPTKALDLGNRNALNADVGDGLADVVEFERLDDRSDHFHFVFPCPLLQVEGLADREDNGFVALADQVLVGVDKSHAEIDFGNLGAVTPLEILALKILGEAADLAVEAVLLDG